MIATVSCHQREQGVPKDGVSTSGSGGNQEQIGLRSKTSANDEVKPDAKKGSRGGGSRARQGPRRGDEGQDRSRG
jgi:hypothetical protein